MFNVLENYVGSLVDTHFARMLTTLEARFNANPKEWEKFLDFFRLQMLDEGDHWVRVGEKCEEFFYISEGIVRIYYIDQDGHEVNEGFYDEGKLLGPISSFANGTPCQYFIQALEPSTLLVANYPRFHAYAYDRPELLRFEITFMQSLFVSNAKRDAKRLLSNGEQRYRWFCREYPHFLERIPQYHIASFLSMTPVSLSRLRKKFSQNEKN